MQVEQMPLARRGTRSAEKRRKKFRNPNTGSRYVVVAILARKPTTDKFKL